MTNATPLAAKQARAAELNRQVEKLERQYDELLERYRGSLIELDRIRADVDEAHTEVVSTRADLARAKRRLAVRAGAIYRAGGTGDIIEFATSGSLSEFFDRVETVQRVGDQDANVLEAVQALNARVVHKERVLRVAKARAATMVARADRDKRKMGNILAQRQSKLDSVNSDIRKIMEAQRRAAQAAAAAKARESAASVTTSGRSGGGSGSGSGGGGMSIPLPPGSSTAAAAANAALSKVGSPYVWGAAGPDSFDCSGLVVWAFAQAGRPGLPHSTYSLVTMGVPVPLDQLQVGDLLFPAGDGHVTIYIGGGQFVHAPHSGDVVKVTSLSSYGMDHARRL